MLDNLRIKTMKCDTMMAKEEQEHKGKMGAEDEEDADQEDEDEEDEEDEDAAYDKFDDDKEEERSEDEATRNQQMIITLQPRAKGTFYKSILNDLKCWKRPPHDHCDRCTEYQVSNDRITELTIALNHSPNDSEKEKFEGIVKHAGGRELARAEKKKLEAKIEDLREHVTWKVEQRGYLKKREETKNHEALL